MTRRRRGGTPRRINIGEEYEVTYWAKALDVSKEQLIAAVAKVGEDLDSVRKELARRDLDRDTKPQSR
jgi:hypothetical protein